MPRPLILRRRGLAYPNGLRPGFDPGHPASSGPLLSALAATGQSNFYNLLKASKGTIVSTPTFVMDANLGPSVNFSAGTHEVDFTGAAITVAAMTMAAIFRPTVVNVGNPCIFSSKTGATTTYLWVVNSTGKLSLFINGSFFDSSISLAANVPYFAAWSNFGSKANVVVVDLRTGATVSQTGASTGTPAAADGTYAIGNDGFSGDELQGRISAVAYTRASLSTPQLLQWAADPWSFWFPTPAGNSAFDPVSISGTSAPAAAVPCDPWPLWAPLLAQ